MRNITHNLLEPQEQQRPESQPIAKRQDPFISTLLPSEDSSDPCTCFVSLFYFTTGAGTARPNLRMTSLRPLLLVRRIEQHHHQQKRQLRTLVTFLNTEMNNAIIKQQRHSIIQNKSTIFGIRSLASTSGNASTSSISSPPSRVDHRINNLDNPLDNPLLRKALIHGQQQQRYPRMSSSLSFVGKNYITKKYFHSSTPLLLNASAAEAPPATDTDADADTAGETKAATSNNDDEEYEYQDMNEIDWAFTPAPPLSEESQKKVDKLFNEILWLDMVEVHLLTEVVNEKMGYGGMDLSGGGGDFDMMAGGAAGGGAGAEEEAKEEKTIFELKLVGFDAKAKIKVIKEIRTITGLGLKEAKEMVESAPKVVQKDLKKDKAEELKAQLEAIGAQVEIE